MSNSAQGEQGKLSRAQTAEVTAVLYAYQGPLFANVRCCHCELIETANTDPRLQLKVLGEILQVSLNLESKASAVRKVRRKQLEAERLSTGKAGRKGVFSDKNPYGR